MAHKGGQTGLRCFTVSMRCGCRQLLWWWWGSLHGLGDCGSGLEHLSLVEVVLVLVQPLSFRNDRQHGEGQRLQCDIYQATPSVWIVRGRLCVARRLFWWQRNAVEQLLLLRVCCILACSLMPGGRRHMWQCCQSHACAACAPHVTYNECRMRTACALQCPSHVMCTACVLHAHCSHGTTMHEKD